MASRSGQISAMDGVIDVFRARFACDTTETAFQEAIRKGNRRTNFRVLLVGIPIVAAYAILDARSLSDPGAAVAYRLTACFAAGCALAMILHPTLRRFQESIVGFIVCALSSILFFVVHNEGSVDNTYYVGLVQNGVAVCFLLRLSFLRSVGLLVFFLAGHAAASAGKPPTGEPAVQLIILVTMFLICGFGNYLIQRYRRYDFWKAVIIERQNERLAALLEAEQKDRQRKVAALNMLVHAVKTPIHQISGFSDLVLMHLSQRAADGPDDGGLESAKYIKSASEDLRDAVTSLLDYYQLDEIERAPQSERFDFAEFLEDEVDLADVGFDITRRVEPAAVAVDRRLAQAAVRNALAAFEGARGVSVEMRPDPASGIARALFEADGVSMDEAAFADATRPLVEIENYLSGDGSSLRMELRTTARALDIAGGSITRLDGDDGVRLELTLPLAEPLAAKEVERKAA